MKILPRTMEGRLRLSAVLIILGLLVQLGSFLWLHPISFVLFIVPGMSLILLGVLAYLLSLLRIGEARQAAPPPPRS